MKKVYSLLILPLFTFILFFFPNVNFAQAPDLGTAANFILFTPIGAVGSTGISNITGNVGSNDGAITGFDSLNGNIYHENGITTQCSADLLIAYDQLNATIATFFPAPVLGNGQVLYAGIYGIPQAASLNANLTLDGQGDPNAIFIFKIQGAFSTTASSNLYLINGARAQNIYWLVEGAVSMAAATNIKGTFIANNGAFSMGIDCVLEGRGLSTTGAISVYGVSMSIPNVILPVTLLEFKASKVTSAIELVWTTANEFALERFQLERSADGSNFYTLGSVTPTNTPFVTNYKWVDNTPLRTNNFYRLKMIDIGHVYKYSAVVKIDMKARQSISIYPNPVTGQTIFLQMYSQPKGVYIINLYSSIGARVMTRRIEHSGHDVVRSVGLKKKFPQGFYYLEICDPEMSNTILKIMIK